MPASSTTTDPTTAVESVLRTELVHRRAEVVAIDERLADDVDRLIGYIFAGGKRLRPQFLCWGFLAAHPDPDRFASGEQLPVGVLRAAAALELIQACALIHDDIIDRSDTRRGQPSVHRSVQKLHADRAWSGDAAHYGLSSALLLGDLALAWADDLFTEGCLDLDAPAEALLAWRAMRTEVLAGQLLDLRISADASGDPQTAAADATVVNRYKTAAYTVERPLHLGAALAGAPTATVAALREYGTVIGIGFQLRDDLLGVFGDPAVTGKPAGGDLIEGKRTVLLAMARAALGGHPELLEDLEAAVGTDLTPAQVDRFTALLAATSAPAEIEERIATLFGTGMDALARRDGAGVAVVHPIAADHLGRLARAAISRDR